MIDRLQTLIEFARLGNMSMVADALRITQPTVSKRLSQLEAELGVQLLRPSGRNLILTEAALNIVEKGRPLISELRSLKGDLDVQKRKRLQVGVSDSVLGSWGAYSFSSTQKKFPELELVLHAHRGPRALALVASGEYQLGLVAGNSKPYPGLLEETVGQEEMVLVGGGKSKGIITSEDSSLSWGEVKLDVLSQGYFVDKRLESFFAVAQLAKANRGLGLVPKGVADAFSQRKDIRSLKPKVYRTVKLVGKKSLFNDADLEAWVLELKASITQRLK